MITLDKQVVKNSIKNFNPSVIGISAKTAAANPFGIVNEIIAVSKIED